MVAQRIVDRSETPLLDRIKQRVTHNFARVLELPVDFEAGDDEIAEQSELTSRLAPWLPKRVDTGGDEEDGLLSRMQGAHEVQVRKGFFALLDSAAAAVPDEVDDSVYRVLLVDPRSVAANPYLPTISTDEGAMEILAQSIRLHGMLDPLHVLRVPEEERRNGERYWVISGERRRQAGIMAGLRQIPVIVKQVTPKTALQIFLAQSIRTYELSTLDHARVYKSLTVDMGMTALQIADRMGVPVEDVEAELAFLEFDEPIQDSIAQRRITREQAKVLAQAPDTESRERLWRYALRHRPGAARMSQRLGEIIGER